MKQNNVSVNNIVEFVTTRRINENIWRALDDTSLVTINYKKKRGGRRKWLWNFLEK
jgi:hypothetical protein